MTRRQIENSNIPYLAANSFPYHNGIQQLLFINASLMTIDKDAFNTLPNLQTLDLTNNKFATLPEDVFQPLKKTLTGIKIAQSRIQMLPPKLFHGLAKLGYLNLEQNMILSLPANLFQNLPILHTVLLQKNNITRLPEDLLQPINGTLALLNLEQNMILSLPANLFQNLAQLHTVFLQKNNITRLPEDLLQPINGTLTKLDLSNNPLQKTHRLCAVTNYTLSSTVTVILPTAVELFVNTNITKAFCHSSCDSLSAVTTCGDARRWCRGTVGTYQCLSTVDACLKFHLPHVTVVSLNVSATFQCENGSYPLNSITTGSCLYHPRNDTFGWSGTRTCKSILSYCPAMSLESTAYQFGVGNATNGIVGSTVICNDGYSRVAGTNESMSGTAICSSVNETHGSWNITGECRLNPTYCPILNLTNGEYQFSIGNATNRIVGATVTVTCSDAYMPVAEADGRSQQSISCLTMNATHGRWEAVECRLNPHYCPALALSHGSYQFIFGSATNRALDATADVICDDGYGAVPETNGSSPTSVSCLEVNATHGRWNMAVACNLNPTYCPALVLANGAYQYSIGNATNRIVGAMVTATCSDAYMPVAAADGSSQQSISCLAMNATHGRWEAVECRLNPHYCPALALSHGSYQFSVGNATNRILGASAAAICKDGYGLVAETDGSLPASAGCLHMSATLGRWNKTAKCEPVICPAVPITVGGLSIQYSSTSKQAGSTATLTCEKAFEPRVAGSPTCMSVGSSVGKWSPEPVCQSILNYCNKLPIGNGQVSYTGGQQKSAVAHLRCFNGYKPHGDRTTFTCQSLLQKTGFWSGSPQCEPKSFYCHTLTIANGQLVYTQRRLKGDTATLSCSQGYRPAAGIAVTTCTELDSTDGTWSPTPTCEAIPGYCPTVSADNGQLAYSANRQLQSTAKLSCDNGYTPKAGSAVVTCNIFSTAHGDWSGTPTCEISTNYCPDEVIANGKLTYLGNRRVQTAAQLSCNHGYAPSNDSLTATCNATDSSGGTWSKIATCEPRENYCGTSKPAASGNITYPAVTALNSVAKLTCELDATLTGPGTFTCSVGTELSGVWNGTSACRGVNMAGGSDSSSIPIIIIAPSAVGVLLIVSVIALLMHRHNVTRQHRLESKASMRQLSRDNANGMYGAESPLHAGAGSMMSAKPSMSASTVQFEYDRPEVRQSNVTTGSQFWPSNAGELDTYADIPGQRHHPGIQRIDTADLDMNAVASAAGGDDGDLYEAMPVNTMQLGADAIRGAGVDRSGSHRRPPQRSPSGRPVPGGRGPIPKVIDRYANSTPLASRDSFQRPPVERADNTPAPLPNPCSDAPPHSLALYMASVSEHEPAAADLALESRSTTPQHYEVSLDPRCTENFYAENEPQENYEAMNMPDPPAMNFDVNAIEQELEAAAHNIGSMQANELYNCYSTGSIGPGESGTAAKAASEHRLSMTPSLMTVKMEAADVDESLYNQNYSTQSICVSALPGHKQSTELPPPPSMLSQLTGAGRVRSATNLSGLQPMTSPGKMRNNSNAGSYQRRGDGGRGTSASLQRSRSARAPSPRAGGGGGGSARYSTARRPGPGGKANSVMGAAGANQAANQQLAQLRRNDDQKYDQLANNTGGGGGRGEQANFNAYSIMPSSFGASPAAAPFIDDTDGVYELDP
ncbi:uncharacterized protein LOC135821148 isoform X2 [Sycon ciliatum]|uniref:uncharacterized protein LOC135821148 isoform X2 n=1 Tax=Sycon ciliatum TaxID=27933 RepID=UPI0031F5F4D5